MLIIIASRTLPAPSPFLLQTSNRPTSQTSPPHPLYFVSAPPGARNNTSAVCCLLSVAAKRKPWSWLPYRRWRQYCTGRVRGKTMGNKHPTVEMQRGARMAERRRTSLKLPGNQLVGGPTTVSDMTALCVSSKKCKWVINAPCGSLETWVKIQY